MVCPWKKNIVTEEQYQKHTTHEYFENCSGENCPFYSDKAIYSTKCLRAKAIMEGNHHE